MTTPTATESSESPSTWSPAKVGAVSYLNTLPLIEGLGKLGDVELTLTAPSRLIDLLLGKDVELALASIIESAIKNRDQVYEMGLAGRRRFEEHFTFKHMMDKNLALYQETVLEEG